MYVLKIYPPLNILKFIFLYLFKQRRYLLKYRVLLKHYNTGKHWSWIWVRYSTNPMSFHTLLLLWQSTIKYRVYRLSIREQEVSKQNFLIDIRNCILSRMFFFFTKTQIFIPEIGTSLNYAILWYRTTVKYVYCPSRCCSVYLFIFTFKLWVNYKNVSLSIKNWTPPIQNACSYQTKLIISITFRATRWMTYFILVTEWTQFLGVHLTRNRYHMGNII